MSFQINGLSPDDFTPLFSLSDSALATCGAMRMIADAAPGYPCRVTLEDAPIGETVILLDHVSHDAPTPFRSAYAIYVRENAKAPASFSDDLPPIMRNRPIALRFFNASAMLVGAEIGSNEALIGKITAAFDRPDIAYIHAHNAMHGCFAAEIRPFSTERGE